MYYCYFDTINTRRVSKVHLMDDTKVIRRIEIDNFKFLNCELNRTLAAFTQKMGQFPK